MSSHGVVRRVVPFVGTACILCLFGLLYFLMNHTLYFICVGVGGGAAVCSLAVTYVLDRTGDRQEMWLLGFFYVIAIVVAPVFAVAAFGRVLGPLTVVFLVALSVVFFYYSYLIPMAVSDMRSDDSPDATPPYPVVTVLVPAYNEAGYIGECIDALRATNYPAEKREVVVIDDGSSDGTYAEAMEHAGEDVQVVQKRNGGKYSAMNYGLLYAAGEIVVTVDADSRIAPGALRTVVGAFQADPDLGAVAGNIKVGNRDGLVAKFQTLEYIVGIMIFRRAFSALGSAPVVPGALGGYRREVLDAVDFYDPDTLTEDFDTTVKTLKMGWRVRAVDARAVTEAPTTWTDLYKQRLRWYRGNFTTLLKHADVFFDSDFGFLHGAIFPMMLLNLTVVPVTGFVIVVSIVLQLLAGELVPLISMFGVFALLQGLLSLVALAMDDERTALAVYAPFFIVGYRQFLDAVVLKAVFDVVVGRDLRWTSTKRHTEPIPAEESD